MPTVAAIREWADHAGPLLPVLFVVAHALVTILPFPRTVFTLSAGVLFGPLLGLALTIVATTLSAVAALLLVRAIGRKAVWQHLSHPAVRRVDAHLVRRGALAVASLRLIAFVPFAVVNYVAGVSSVRALPYTIATLVGIVPGTAAVVILGDAAAGGTHPGLLAISVVCVIVGMSGLVFDLRRASHMPDPGSDTEITPPRKTSPQG
ncbi:TVP38/TMEM64 family protein [Rhodococcus rhodnii]|nr:TVP38/TMEM64 family protein [Rhodococcus rhodnii]